MGSLIFRVHVAIVAFAVGTAASLIWDSLQRPHVFAPRPAATARPPVESPPAAAPDAGAYGFEGGEDLAGEPHPYACPPLPYNEQVTGQAQPAYPPEAKRAGASGSVSLHVVVDEGGRVVMAHPVSGHPLLREAAVDAACRSRFTPPWLLTPYGRTERVLTFYFVPR